MFTDPLINDKGFYNPVCKDFDYRQTQFEFFWPLTEQIPLDLDYTDCAKKIESLVISNGTTGTYLFANNTWGTVATNIAPQLTITPINSVGQLSIGGVNVGLETEPTWYQKLLYKALGFNWKNK